MDSLERPDRAYLQDVSIIIPVGPQDDSWRCLVPDLAVIASQAEIWFVAVDPAPEDFAQFMEQQGVPCSAQWVVSPPGRARQMNLGARQSSHPVLWFLHADSRLDPEAIRMLDEKLMTDREALYFFDLKFHHGSPKLSRWNAAGVRFRSRSLGLPFGDQGLCISRDQFYRLGCYPESARYGEDHLLVWEAHRQRVLVRPVNASISTSARKYQNQGWLRTTAMHLFRTGWQALPQFVRYLGSRIR